MVASMLWALLLLSVVQTTGGPVSCETPREDEPPGNELPAAARPLFDEAKKKVDADDHKGAFVLMEKLAAQEPKCAWIQHYTAEVAYLGGQYAIAIRYCDQALKLDPKQKESWNIRAHANLRLNRIAESEKDFTKELEIDSGRSEARFVRAHCRRLLGYHEEALKDILEVRKIRNDREAVLLHALILCDNLLIEEAQREIDKIVTANPSDAEGRLLRGAFLLARAKEKEADAEFAKAVELDNTLKKRVATLRTEAHVLQGKLKAKEQEGTQRSNPMRP